MNAGKLKPGDAVEFDSISPTLIGKQVVVPGNAVFHGHVLRAEAANANEQKESQLSILVDSVTWKNKTVPLCAAVVGFGSREFRSGESTSVPVFDEKKWVATSARQRGMALQALADMPLDTLNTPSLSTSLDAIVPTSGAEPLVVRWQGFVQGVEFHTGTNAVTVLTRKKKDIKLPGGLLVGLRQLPLSGGSCPVSNTP